MTPENHFCPTTAPFVAIVKFVVGTSAYGYGDTSEEALVDIDESTYEIFGRVESTVVWKRTDETKRRGRLTFQIYERV